MAKNPASYQKRQREMDKKRKADDKRKRRQQQKDAPPSQRTTPETPDIDADSDTPDPMD